MKLFIDTANLADIRAAADLGVLDGVTTSPALLAKEGIHGTNATMAHYRAICELVEGDVLAELSSTDYEKMLSEGEVLADLHPNIVVQVPLSQPGLQAIKHFSKKYIRTNCALVYSAGQALLAAKAGATFVAIGVGPLDDTGADGLAVVAQVVEIFANYGFVTEVLAANTRHVPHLTECAELGVDAAACPPAVFTNLLHHPLTEQGASSLRVDAKGIMS